MQIWLSRRWTPGMVAACLLAAACGGAPAQPTSTKNGETTGPTTTNAAPTVTVDFDGASTCTPSGSTPCTLTAVAHASDADGDALSYAWSGCASGTAPRGTCTVTTEGDVTASVQVSDGHGHQATASATGHGNAPGKTNSPPTARASFDGANDCSPMPTKPCTLPVSVTATDSDGDALEYKWEGCATGSATHSTCTVSKPGPVRAVVTVNDKHGHDVVVWATAVGDNAAPKAQIGSVSMWASGAVELLGNVIDPEEGMLCGGNIPYCVSVKGSGACSAAATCSALCLGGLEIQAKATSRQGTCTLTIEVQDSWGKHGTTNYTFDLADPAIHRF